MIKSECYCRMHYPRRLFYTPYIIFGILLLYLSGCMIQTLGNTMSKFMLTRADNGKTIQVHPGDEIIISLDENPSTGYKWAVDKTDNAILSLQNSGFTPTSGGAVGSGGTRVFTFVAKSAGSVQLQLKYWRSFEGDSSIVQRFSVTIQAQS